LSAQSHGFTADIKQPFCRHEAKFSECWFKYVGEMVSEEKTDRL